MRLRPPAITSVLPAFQPSKPVRATSSAVMAPALNRRECVIDAASANPVCVGSGARQLTLSAEPATSSAIASETESTTFRRRSRRSCSRNAPRSTASVGREDVRSAAQPRGLLRQFPQRLLTPRDNYDIIAIGREQQGQASPNPEDAPVTGTVIRDAADKAGLWTRGHLGQESQHTATCPGAARSIIQSVGRKGPPLDAAVVP